MAATDRVPLLDAELELTRRLVPEGAIVLATSSDGTIASTATFAIALAGIPAYIASFGSCTIMAPPLALITARPADPSSRVPVSTTPTTRVLSAAAAERNRTSIAGR
jgi:hypothetical protein